MSNQTPPGTQQPNPVPDLYDSNTQSLQFTSKKNVLQYGFGVITQFTGNIIYTNPGKPIALYGGAETNRGDKNDGTWDNGYWPGQVMVANVNGKPGASGAQYLIANNPSCGVQPECTFKKGSTGTTPTIPDLSKNTCCVPYFDKDSLLTPGNDYIFNSYYGSCYSGYNWNYDWCSNKQIWIQATVDEINSTVYGKYGVPNLEISYALNPDSKGKPQTLIQQSRNTKDRVFMGGRGNQGGNAGSWGCTLKTGGYSKGQDGPWCGFPKPTQGVEFASVNYPQASLNAAWSTQFPNVGWSNTDSWALSGGCQVSAPNGCPANCPNPQGWQRWGAKYIGSGNPPGCGGDGADDKASDWEPVLPGGGGGSIGVWMPRGYNYNLQYSPSIVTSSNNPATGKPMKITQPIFTTTSTVMTEDPKTSTGIQQWLSDICAAPTTSTGKATALKNLTGFSPSVIAYLLYGTVVHSISTSIFNDIFISGGSETPSGLTIFNSITDYINVWKRWNYSNESANPPKSSSDLSTPPIKPFPSNKICQAVNGYPAESIPTPGPLPTGVTNALIWRNATNPVELTKVIMMPTITRSVKGTAAKQLVVYTLTITESLLQFQSASNAAAITAAYTNNDWATLGPLLNTHITNIANGFFGSGSSTSGESLSIAGKTQSGGSIQQLILQTTGTTASSSGVKFNTFDFVTGTAATASSDPYSFFNAKGIDHSQVTNLGVASGDSNVISVTYTATITTWSPMAILYYSYFNDTIALEPTDPLCKNDEGTVPLPNICAQNLMTSNPSSFLKICENAGGTTQAGGIIYSPPKKVFLVNGNASTITNVTPKLMGPPLTGDGGVPYFLMTSDSNQCQCVQKRLQLRQDVGKMEDPRPGMCFSLMCDDNMKKLLGLTPKVCSSGNNCDQICSYVQSMALENIQDFDETTYNSVCGKPCEIPRYQSGRLAPDVLVSTGIIIAVYIATHLIVSKDKSIIGKIFHSIMMAALIGSFGFIVSKAFNGNWYCGTVKNNPFGASPGACQPTWPLGGKTIRDNTTGLLSYKTEPPQWLLPYWNMLKLPDNACPYWYKIPCECGLNTDTAGELNCFCGGACGCKNQRCFATVDGMSTKTRDVPVTKINYVYLITLVIVGILLMMIGKHFMEGNTMNGALKDIIYILILILPAGVYYLMNMKPGTFAYKYTDCTSKSPPKGTKPPKPCPAK